MPFKDDLARYQTQISGMGIGGLVNEMLRISHENPSVLDEKVSSQLDSLKYQLLRRKVDVWSWDQDGTSAKYND